MREIKFRAWDSEKHLMYERVGSSAEGLALNGFDEHMSACTLMQFTGLKDKSGKEIYEGDILEKEGCHRSVVEYRDGAFQTVHDHHDLSGHKNGEYEQPLGFLIVPLQVVGNIYENPDLLQ